MKSFYKIAILITATNIYAQNPGSVDFTECNAWIELNPVKQNVWGKVEYQFNVNNIADTIRIDAKKMEINNLTINNKKVNFKNNQKEILLYEGYNLGNNIVSFNYEAFPVQAMYFIQRDNYQDIQIWTQGQGKETSNWFPSFDDQNEKIIFNLNIDFNKEYTVLSNGILKNKSYKNNYTTWEYKMNKPMSSYLLMLAIGKFHKKNFTSKNGIPNELWLHEKDTTKFETTYKYSKEIFDFLEEKLKVNYPWEIYRQVPVWDFLYGGMENTTTTIFNQDYVVDEKQYIDKNYINVNAHELAHQWFGNLITATESKHHWLHEGFATYYALLAEKKIFGEDHFYWRLYENAVKIEQASISDDIPILNEKASSLSFYQKGAWALHTIAEKIGEEKFDKIISNYLNKYSFKNVTTDDFFNEINKITEFDTKLFSEKWLETSQFQKDEVYKILNKNKFIKQYLDLKNSPLNITKDKDKIINIITGDYNENIKELIIIEAEKYKFEDKKYLIDIIFEINNPKLNQTLALTNQIIHENKRIRFEKLLFDPSYITNEIVFTNLYSSFPEKRNNYIKLIKSWEKSPQINLQIIYSTLLLIHSPENKIKQYHYKKLLNFTGTNFESSIRQNAIQRLLELEIHNNETFKSLAYGISHHKWKFSLFCRDKIKELIKNLDYKEIFRSEILPELPYKEQIILNRILKNPK